LSLEKQSNSNIANIISVNHGFARRNTEKDTERIQVGMNKIDYISGKYIILQQVISLL